MPFALAVSALRRPSLTLLTGAALLATSTLISPGALAGWSDLLESGQKMLQSTDDNSANTPLPAGVDQPMLNNGLKEALSVGAERAIRSLSATDGYLGNPAVRIPLPGMIGSAAGLLRTAGYGDQVDAFELSMNRAAENAVTEASPIIADSLTSMTIEDAQQIYRGGDSAATEYFRSKTYDQLKTLFRPKIEQSMSQTGVTAAYQGLTRSATSQVPMLGTMNLDLADYVTAGALDGLFTMLAAEEKKIRQNPAARTTELLQSVFGR